MEEERDDDGDAGNNHHHGKLGRIFHWTRNFEVQASVEVLVLVAASMLELQSVCSRQK